MKWMTQDSKDWTPKTMREFIQTQNNYRYDGGSPIQHSAKSLASFAGIEGKQLEKFVKVYNTMYEMA
jgi:hypothetical protein